MIKLQLTNNIFKIDGLMIQIFKSLLLFFIEIFHFITTRGVWIRFLKMTSFLRDDIIMIKIKNFEPIFNTSI